MPERPKVKCRQFCAAVVLHRWSLPGRNPLHDTSKNVAPFSMSQSPVYQQVTRFASLAAVLMVAESEELLIVCPLARQATTIVCSDGISNIRIHGRHCEWRSASFALAIW